MFLSGCSTISEGTLWAERSILITSTPSDALVKYNGSVKGKTPMHLSLSPHYSKQEILIEKKGFTSALLDPKGGANAGVLGNILFGGLLGLAVDLASGSIIGTKDGIHVALEVAR